MNSENFEKLFTKDFANAKLASFNMPEAQTFKRMPKSEKRKAIEDRQQTISPEYAQAIQRYINEHKGRVQGKQLRQMVKKHFGITVIDEKPAKSYSGL